MTALRSRSLASSALVLALGIGLGLALACASDPEPAPETDFVGKDTELAEDPRVPLQRVWRDPQADMSSYDSITIAPVNTDHVAEAEWWQKTVMKGQLRREDLHNLADYARQKFELAFARDEEARLEYVSAPRDGTIILETALVEIVPSKSVLGIVPLSDKPRGSTAIEGRLRDARTDQVVMKFADRRTGKVRPIKADPRWNSAAKEAIDTWAEVFVRIANADGAEPVEDASDFSLKPWGGGPDPRSP